MKKITGAIRLYFDTTDKWLLFFWLGTSVISLVILSAIVAWGGIENLSMKMQIAATIMGVVMALAISLFDYHTLLKLWRLYVPVMALLMLYTLFFGVGKGDANTNWIEIPIGSNKFNLQPSEFLKIVFITTLALHLSKTREHLNSIGNVVLLVLHGAGYFALMYQDNGSLLVFLFIFIIMLFCSGIQWRYILIGAAALTAALPLVWQLMSADQKERFLVVSQPELNPAYAYQQLWGLYALATGGREGVGLFGVNHVYVPEIHNDMIFTFIGEATGFMGCLGVIALLTFLSIRILYDSARAKDDTGRHICVGVFAMMIAQTFINLGMCLRVTPVIGVTLPLFSTGGTSVLSLYIGLGFVLSVYRNSATGLFTEKSA